MGEWMEIAREWIIDHPRGVFASAVVGMVILWCKSIYRWLWKFVHWLRRLECVGSFLDLRSRSRPWRSNNDFHCVRCGLANTDGNLTTAIKEALGVIEGAFGSVDNVELRSSYCVVEKTSGAEGAPERAMQERAERILKAWAGHLAVIAQVMRTDNILKLWFVPRDTDGTFSSEACRLSYYKAAQVKLQGDFYDPFHLSVSEAVLQAKIKFATVRA